MLKNRLLLKFTCLLLGSCTITPQSSVYIYTNDNQPAHEVKAVVNGSPSKDDKCTELELTELKEYALPKLPTVDKLDTNDPQAAKVMMGTLFDTLEIHRKEIRRLQAAYRCTLEGHRTK